MSVLKVLRISIVMLGLGLACLTARPCRAQAEINPDHYDDAPSSTSTVRPATTTHTVASTRTDAAPRKLPCAEAGTPASSPQAGCGAHVHSARKVVRASTPAAKDKAAREVASTRRPT
ncbi:MAG: hypothetical protein WB987_07040 [Candidatus Acidiferrales bacterium]